MAPHCPISPHLLAGMGKSHLFFLLSSLWVFENDWKMAGDILQASLLALSPILQAWNMGLLLEGRYVHGSKPYRCQVTNHAIRGAWDRMKGSLGGSCACTPGRRRLRSADERLGLVKLYLASTDTV